MRANQVGFTLIEMIVTMVVAGVLFAVGIPSLVSMIRSNRLAGITNELISTLMYARSEAVKRNVPVGICRSSDGATCVTGGTTGWEIGWMTYLPSNANGNFTAGDTVLNVHEAMDSSIWTRGNNNVANKISFNSLGLTNGGMGALTVSFGGVTTNNNNIRLLCIAISGRPRLMPKSYVPATCTAGVCDCPAVN